MSDEHRESNHVTVDEYNARVKCKHTIIQPPSGMRCWVVWENYEGPSWLEGPIPVIAIRVRNDEIEADPVCLARAYRATYRGKTRQYTERRYRVPDGALGHADSQVVGRSGFEEGYFNALVLAAPGESMESPFQWIDESHLRFNVVDGERLRKYYDEQADQEGAKNNGEGG